MSNLTFKIDSVDVTENVVFGSFKLNFKRNNFNTCAFMLKNTILISPGSTYVVEILLGASKIFYGHVISSDLEFYSADTYLIKINACDANMLVMSYTTTSHDYSSGAYTEKQILEGIFSGWTPYPITTHVITGDLYAIKWTDASVRRMIDDLANAKGRYWYFDGDMELHWFASTGETAPFGLSDSPNDITTFKYGNLKVKVDKDGIYNVIGGSLICWQDGLRAGMALPITNSFLGWTAETFIITEVEMSVLNKAGLYEYRVSFGNQKPRITDYILRSNKVASTVDAGLVPPLPNDTTKYLRGDGSWSVGSGSIPKLDDCLAPDDNTDLNASTSKHGLLPKLPNDVSKLLSGLGTWIDTPQHGLDNNLRHSAPVDVTNFNASISAHGFLPKLNGNSSYFLNGLGNWAIPAGGGGAAWPTPIVTTYNQYQRVSGGYNYNYSYHLIVLVYCASAGAATRILTAYVNGVLVAKQYWDGASCSGFITFVVPRGQSYMVYYPSPTDFLWTEVQFA